MGVFLAKRVVFSQIVGLSLLRRARSPKLPDRGPRGAPSAANVSKTSQRAVLLTRAGSGGAGGKSRDAWADACTRARETVVLAKQWFSWPNSGFIAKTVVFLAKTVFLSQNSGF